MDGGRSILHGYELRGCHDERGLPRICIKDFAKIDPSIVSLLKTSNPGSFRPFSSVE